MKEHKISWTERTWNPVTGCTKIAAGCKNCYAETMFNRLSEMDFKGNIYRGRKFTDVQIHPERLGEPYKWKQPCMVFVNSMADLFHERVGFKFVYDVFLTMQKAKQHTFQVLTKRPERMKEFINTYYSTKDYMGNPNYNVWLGVSVSTQADADKNIPILLDTPAAVRWVSVEPMLEEVDIKRYLDKEIAVSEVVMRTLTFIQKGEKPTEINFIPNKLDWVVVGCESGHGRRECKIEWVESIVEQCKSAGVPVFVKQLQINGKVTKRVEDFPDGLRIREFPKRKSDSATN